jgi:hypothetical protein
LLISYLCNGNPEAFLIDLRCIRSPIRNQKGQLKNHMKFRSPEHLQSLCDEYFASCQGVIYNNKTGMPFTNRDGSPVVGQIRPYTISGLALYLDVTTSVLRGYGKGLRDELGFPEDDEVVGLQYSDVIRRARQRIEAYAEERLYDKDGFNGSRFVLDVGFKWLSTRDAAEIENMIAIREQRAEEFKLKKELLDSGDEDGNINITITRKSKEGDEDA